MKYSLKIILFLIFPFLFSCEHLQKSNDLSFRHMPQLFSFDDYVDCMQLTNSLYCMITLELHAESDNALYNFIQDYSSNYCLKLNHSLLDRGVCVPKTCKVYTKKYKYTVYKEDDLRMILEECYNKTIYDEYQLYAKVQKLHYCSTNETKPKETKLVDWITIIIVIGILMINFMGSCSEFYLKDKFKHINFLRSFSVSANWEDLFKKSIQSNEVESFPAFHGLRVIALSIIIFAHSTLYIFVLTDSVEYYEELQIKGYYQIIKYGLNFVQLFFMTSGFLLAYKFCEAEETNTFSLKDMAKLIFARYMRLSPTYAVVLLLTVSCTPYFAYGPFWEKFAGAAARDCHTYFWYHMFYINNYNSDDKQCAIQTWHVAVDMQLFIVGLLVLILTKRRRMAVLWILWLLSFVGPVISVLNGLEPVAIITPQCLRNFDDDTLRFSHIRGHNNLTSFVAAMIIGQLNYKWRKQGFKIENKFFIWPNMYMYKYFPYTVDQTFPQLLAQSFQMMPILVIVVFLSIKLLYTGAFEQTLTTKLIFLFIFRISLSLIAWWTFTVMAMKLESPLYRVLIWSGWQVPSKLCYCMYLVHMEIIYLLLGTRTTKATTSILHLFITYFGLMVLSVILALILHILIEAPFNKLLKLSLKAREQNKKSEKKVE